MDRRLVNTTTKVSTTEGRNLFKVKEHRLKAETEEPTVDTHKDKERYDKHMERLRVNGKRKWCWNEGRGRCKRLTCAAEVLHIKDCLRRLAARFWSLLDEIHHKCRCQSVNWVILSKRSNSINRFSSSSSTACPPPPAFDVVRCSSTLSANLLLSWWFVDVSLMKFSIALNLTFSNERMMSLAVSSRERPWTLDSLLSALGQADKMSRLNWLDLVDNSIETHPRIEDSFGCPAG